MCGKLLRYECETSKDDQDTKEQAHSSWIIECRYYNHCNARQICHFNAIIYTGYWHGRENWQNKNMFEYVRRRQKYTWKQRNVLENDEINPNTKSAHDCKPTRICTHLALEKTGFWLVNCSSTLAARVRRSPLSPTLQLMMSLAILMSRILFAFLSAIFLSSVCQSVNQSVF